METLKEDESAKAEIIRCWNKERESVPHCSLLIYPDPTTDNALPNLSCCARVTLNKLHIDVGRFRKSQNQWSVTDNSKCSRSTEEHRITTHIIQGQCKLFHPSARPVKRASPITILRNWFEETRLEVHQNLCKFRLTKCNCEIFFLINPAGRTCKVFLTNRKNLLARLYLLNNY